MSLNINSPLIILGGGPQQRKVYEISQSLNIKTLCVDKNKNCIGASIADYYLNVSVKNSQKIIRKLEETKLNFSGVITCGVEASIQVSEIANHFNLIGIPIKVAEATTNKSLRLQILTNSGILCPRFKTVNNIKDSTIKFPFVVKPIDSSGSRGVCLVKNAAEYEDAFLDAQELSSDNHVILEEYINGTEVSIEGFVINGRLNITGIAERHFLDVHDTYPNFVEYGGTMPPTFSEGLIKKCETVFDNAVKALGIEEGPTKGDLIISSEEVYVLEITSRSSPGFAAEMQPIANGLKPLEILVRWSVGDKINESDFRALHNKGVAHRYFIHEPGVIEDIQGVNKLKNFDGIKHVLILDKPFRGKTLEKINYMNRMLYVISEGGTNQEAIESARKALDSIKIIYR